MIRDRERRLIEFSFNGHPPSLFEVDFAQSQIEDEIYSNFSDVQDVMNEVADLHGILLQQAVRIIEHYYMIHWAYKKSLVR